MIDLHSLRADSAAVIARIARKDPSFDGSQLVALDKEVRQLKIRVDDLRAEKNELAKQGKGGVTPALRDQAKQVGVDLKQAQMALEEQEKAFKYLYLRCPNLLFDDVPDGTEADNVVVKTWGAKPTLSFEPKHHLDLGLAHKWFDFEAAARMSGSNFCVFTGQGAMVAYKLLLYMLQHNMGRGYQPVLPPLLVNEQALQGAGNFPRFADEVYHVEDENLYLTPTAEVNLTSMYRDHIFAAEDLPVRMTAWTNCFRKEAGGYGATERGLIRLHQFNKVEIYALSRPEDAQAEHAYMLETAEQILQALNLHYRVSMLAAQDCSFSSAKTYDIEVWMPGQGVYKEVSSVSNCTDFQARRSNIRYRDEPGAKPRFVSTLNGSSLALPRLLVALLETYQQADGSVVLPSVISSVTVE